MSQLQITHPEYDTYVDQWQLLRRAYEGEESIKAQNQTYLPPTPGQVLDGLGLGEQGLANYSAYLQRAVFPDYVADAVEVFIGLLHREPATIELPAKLERLRERSTLEGEDLQALLRRINEQQLVTGRLGLILDMPEKKIVGEPNFYIALYHGESIRNWDVNESPDGQHSVNFVVLDESGPVRINTFEWEEQEQYRVVALGTPDDVEAGVQYYRTGRFNLSASQDYNESEMAEPTARGKRLEQVPFVFVNSNDNAPNPSKPPLLGLARLALTIYRGEADYRNTLFLQGQDTLVVKGGILNLGEDGEAAVRVGAGARLDLEPDGDAKYISVGAEGLAEQREAIEADRKRAEAKAGKLIQDSKGGVESGDALQTRLAAQTATLTRIALSGASALERLLRIAAEWVGANPDEVKVTPNTDFAEDIINTRSLVEIMSAKAIGLPLSMESVHEYLQERKLTSKDYEDELRALEEEALLAEVAEGTGEPEEEDELEEEGDE